jgi:hypothetical protein
MPDWWTELCLLVFITHMPFFAWRYRQTREIRFGATTLTFALLSVTYGIRVFTPELVLAGTALWQWVRVPAWLSAVVSIGLLARHYARGT